MVPKRRMGNQPFMLAFERSNVDAGLLAGFAWSARIGKGMWAMPEFMHDMLEQKVATLGQGEVVVAERFAGFARRGTIR